MASGAADMEITEVEIDPEDPGERKGRNVEFELTAKNNNTGSGFNFGLGYIELVEAPSTARDGAVILKACASVGKGDTFRFDDSTVDNTLEGEFFVPENANGPFEVKVIAGGFTERDIEGGGCTAISPEASATDTRTIELEVEAQNEPPNAVATADKTSGRAPLTVTFSGSQSSDPNNNIQSYQWSFSSGGSATGQTVTRTFTESDVGTVTAELVVEDSNGLTSSDSVQVNVQQPANEPPNAVATANPVSGQTPLEVRFDGGQSTDPDGTIQEYQWDFSDGVTKSGEVVTRTFTEDAPTSVDCTLTVIDAGGNTASDSITVSLNKGGGGGGGGGVIGEIDDETIAQAAIVGAGVVSSVVVE